LKANVWWQHFLLPALSLSSTKNEKRKNIETIFKSFAFTFFLGTEDFSLFEVSRMAVGLSLPPV